MDIKKLILEVEKRAEIWNPNHHLHHKRARIVEIWNKISTRTGFSSNLHITNLTIRLRQINHLQRPCANRSGNHCGTIIVVNIKN